MTKKIKSITKKSLSATKYTVLFTVLHQTISVVVLVLLLKVLTEFEYGIYNLLYSVIGLLGMFASFGIANALQRYIPEYYSRGEFKVARNLFRFSSWLRLFSNVIILGLVLFFWETVSPYIKIYDYRNYFMLFCSIVILYMQRELLEISLDSYFLQKYTKGFSVIFIIIKAAGYSYAIWHQMNLWNILVVDLIAYAVTFIALQIIYYRRIPAHRGSLEKIPLFEKKRISRYAVFYNFNDAGVGLLDTNFDNFIIALYLNPIAVGAYAFCYKITKMIGRIIPVNYLKEVIRPAFFSLGIDFSTKQINVFYQILLKITYLFHFPIFCFLAVLGKELIIILFNGKFLEYSSVLNGVYFFSMLYAFQLPLGIVAQLKEKADVILYSKVFAIYNLIADIIFIKYFGIWGAVIATGTAILGKNIFIWISVKEEASFRGLGNFFFKMIGIWAFIGSIIFCLKWYIKDYLIVFSLGVLLIMIFFLVQFRFRLFNDIEKDIIVNLNNKKLNYLLKILGI